MSIVIMRQSDIWVKQAKADADSLIVSIPLNVAELGDPVVVVSRDTDILVMLVVQAASNMDLYILCQKFPTLLYRIRDIQENIGHTGSYLMVIHAITGCDTVSALYRQGKRKAFNMVQKKQEYGLLKVFDSPNSTHQEVQNAGEMH